MNLLSFNISPHTRYILIGLCALFTFGGAVNLGYSGYVMATPFMALWLWLIYKSSRIAVLISLALFIAIIPFYFLKKTDNPLFFPANGMSVVLRQDTCIHFFNGYIQTEPITGTGSTDGCLNTKNNIPDILQSKIIPKGTRYTITHTEVSNADMGETYIPHIQNNDGDGDITVTDTRLLLHEDGSDFDITDMRRPVFYYPSMLMMWPALPFYFFVLLQIIF